MVAITCAPIYQVPKEQWRFLQGHPLALRLGLVLLQRALVHAAERAHRAPRPSSSIVVCTRGSRGARSLVLVVLVPSAWLPAGLSWVASAENQHHRDWSSGHRWYASRCIAAGTCGHPHKTQRICTRTARDGCLVDLSWLSCPLHLRFLLFGPR